MKYAPSTKPFNLPPIEEFRERLEEATLDSDRMMKEMETQKRIRPGTRDLEVDYLPN